MNSPDTPAPATTTRNFRSAITPRKTGQSPPRWPKFKPPAAVTTTGAGDPCLTLREPPSLPPGGADAVSTKRGVRYHAKQRPQQASLLSLSRSGRRDRAGPDRAFRPLPPGRRRQQMGSADAGPARDAGGARARGASAEARDNLRGHAIRALSQRRPRRALGEGRNARPRAAGVVGAVPPARPRRDPGRD